MPAVRIMSSKSNFDNGVPSFENLLQNELQNISDNNIHV